MPEDRKTGCGNITKLKIKPIYKNQVGLGVTSRLIDVGHINLPSSSTRARFGFGGTMQVFFACMRE